MRCHPRQLQVVDINHARFNVSLEASSGLQELELHRFAVLEPQCRLPPSLTRLRLTIELIGEDQDLPNQASRAL